MLTINISHAVGVINDDAYTSFTQLMKYQFNSWRQIK